MREINISSIVNLDSQYQTIVDTTRTKYSCEWDDAVHDSFKRYVDEIQQYSEELRNIRKNTEINMQKIDELQIDNLVSKSDELCSEVDGL